ncbi:membrane protein [Propionicimonas paludicola]|uniref:Membrane protein n=1 Tax=Propionicimonas paludicola TaxID=185243 RepID=A0A2A9CSP6_9ACTN|nr:YhjD/YihY/BrkB family envelope integrity protein [Propionicimonas paludicola]PFG16632.1 membrane protein [Propionicimonas paludicola]
MQEWWSRFSQRAWVAHVLRTVERFNVRGGGIAAAAIAYYSVLSMVPVLMLVFSALGLTLTVWRPDSLVVLNSYLSDELAAFGDLGKQLEPVIRDALSNWAGIGTTGLVIALWTGTNWIGNLKRATRVLMRTDVDRPDEALPFYLDLPVNFAALIALIAGVLASFAATGAATSLGSTVAGWLGVTGAVAAFMLRAVSLLISLVVGVLLFWWLFSWFAPHPVPPRLVRAAAVIGSVALIALQFVAGALIGVFSGNLAANLFGPVIIAMLFLNLFATLILYLAAWLATAEAPLAAEPEPVIELPSEPEPVETKPGQHWVSAEVARRSMGVGLGTGYTVGAATGLGLGAVVAMLVARLRGKAQ